MVELPHNLREVTDAVVLRGVDGEERYHEKKYGGQASEPVGLVLFHGCDVYKKFIGLFVLKKLPSFSLLSTRTSLNVFALVGETG